MTNKSSSGTKTQTKKLISPEDQFARDPNANPEKASTGLDPITDAKLEILSTVASAPVFFTPATAIPEAIQSLMTWEDSNLEGELYSRNFKNVILSRISGTPTKLETYQEANKKTGELKDKTRVVSNVTMPHSTGEIVGLEENGKQKRELAFAGGRLTQVSLTEIGEACPYSKMTEGKDTIEMVVNFFELHHNLRLWCDVHEIGQPVRQGVDVTLRPAQSKEEKVFACGVEILPPDEKTGGMRTRAWWVAHVPRFSHEKHVEQVNLKLGAKHATDNARQPMPESESEIW